MTNRDDPPVVRPLPDVGPSTDTRGLPSLPRPIGDVPSTPRQEPARREPPRREPPSDPGRRREP